jgi:hypothetical protein
MKRLGPLAAVVNSGPDMLALAIDGRLLRFDLASATAEVVGDATTSFLGAVSGMYLSPGGTNVAVAIDRWDESPSRSVLGLFNLATGEYQQVERPCPGQIAWLDTEHIAAVDNCEATTLVFDTELALVEELTEAVVGFRDTVTANDGTRYWAEHGELWALPAGSRSPTHLASFDTPLNIYA